MAVAAAFDIGQGIDARRGETGISGSMRSTKARLPVCRKCLKPLTWTLIVSLALMAKQRQANQRTSMDAHEFLSIKKCAEYETNFTPRITNQTGALTG